MRVLIADDEPAIRTVLRRVLMRHFMSLEVVEAENGLDALERLSHDRYSLLILDVNMPVMTGTEALRSLRRHPQTATLPVIMMTADTNEGTIRQIMQLGVSDYVLKPVRPGFVVERVARLMDSLNDGDGQIETTRMAAGPMQISPRTRVLLVDGSADFRQFFTETVGSMCKVTETAFGIDALKRSLTEAPEIMFIGSETGVLTSEDLAEKMRHTVRSAPTTLVRILPPRSTRKERRDDLYDAVIPRTFVASALKASIEALTREPGSMHRVLTLVPQLKLLAMASVEQVAALSLGTTVTPKEGLTGNTNKSIEASLGIEVRQESVTLMLTIGASAKSAKVMAARLHETLQEEVSDEAANAALSELVTTTADRLASALQELGVQTNAGMPVVSPDSKKRKPPSADAIVFTVESSPAEFSMYVRLDGVRRPVG